MHMDWHVAGALGVMFFAAGVKGVIGFGFPLISIPVLSSLLGARVAVVAFTLPGIVSNLIIIVQGWQSEWERWFFWLLGGVGVGAILGARLVTSIPTSTLDIIVGAISLTMLASGPFLARFKVSGKHLRTAAPAAGLAAGVLGGTTDIYSPILAAYLQLLNVPKERFAVLLCVLFVLGSGLQTTTFALSGMFTPFVLKLALMFFVPMLAGIWVGIRVRARVNARLFRIFVTVLIVASCLNLLRQGLFG